MPILGILHLLAAMYFGVHAIRSGQNMYWLIILFLFPFMGSVVYFFAIYLPESRLQHNAKKAITTIANTLDPERELREAQMLFDDTPTAQNQMRLASALLKMNRAEEAAKHYEACLNGPFSGDNHIKFCTAHAFVECGRGASAIQHLEEIRSSDPKFQPEQLVILLARALAIEGRQQEAKQEFENVVNSFGSFDARAEYMIWAIQAGDEAVVTRLKPELDRTISRWNKQTRDLNAPLLCRLQAAREAAHK